MSALKAVRDTGTVVSPEQCSQICGSDISTEKFMKFKKNLGASSGFSSGPCSAQSSVTLRLKDDVRKHLGGREKTVSEKQVCVHVLGNNLFYG